VAYHARPLAAAPLQPLGLLERIRDTGRRLRGKAPLGEQGRKRRRMIQDAQAARDAVWEQRRVPAARGIARRVGAGFDPGGQLASLGLGPLAGAARGPLVRSTGEGRQPPAVAVSAHGWFAQAQQSGAFLDAHVLGQSEQSVETLDQPERAAGVGLRKTALELLAREGTAG
jgi:hypothetical protein